jgi:hypothetical protein
MKKPKQKAEFEETQKDSGARVGRFVTDFTPEIRDDAADNKRSLFTIRKFQNTDSENIWKEKLQINSFSCTSFYKEIISFIT